MDQTVSTYITGLSKIQLSSSVSTIFDKLIDAYAKLAEAMPPTDRLQSAINDDASFRIVLALIYVDILEFHRRAYNFFRRRGELAP